MISSLKFLIIFSIFFAPGIIWNFIAIKYKHGRNRNPSDTIFIIQSIVLTTVTYFCEYILLKIYDHSSKLFELLNNEIYNNNSKEAISSDLIYFAILSIPLAIVFSILDLYEGKYDFFYNLLKMLPFVATERYGNEDVWERFLCSKSKEADKKKETMYVKISDFENKIIYLGHINHYSDTDKLRELSLIDVIVRDFEGNELYKVSEMYISRPSESITMEFLEETKGEDDEKK
ncbi:MAG: hypothetical protein J6P77_00845 [Acetobacter sp.]|nr:hypothetical protein [Acetobacter sp.]